MNAKAINFKGQKRDGFSIKECTITLSIYSAIMTTDCKKVVAKILFDEKNTKAELMNLCFFNNLTFDIWSEDMFIYLPIESIEYFVAS